MKKKVAIVTLAVAMENEKGYSRFRTLAEILSEKYDVDIITSTFQHWEKKQRDSSVIEAMQTSYGIKLAYEPGYKNNVDLRRVFSHRIAVRNILQILSGDNYNLIYCIIPDNRMAAMVGKYAKLRNIKYIVDIEDLWPEAMEMVSPLPKFVNCLLLSSFRKYARVAYECADAFIGTSDEYRDVPSVKYGIYNKSAKTVYVGCDLNEYDNGVREFISLIEKSDDEFWVTYAGNLGSSYDIPTMIHAAQELYKAGNRDIKIKLLGGGPLESYFKEIARERECEVEFVGYTPYKKMAAYLVKSDVLINSFVRKAPQSIVTKIGDYLAAGKPMINTCSSPEFRNKVENDGFGINVWAEDTNALVNAIIDLYKDQNKCIKMGKTARLIAEEQFDRKNSYQVIVKQVSDLIGD